MKKTASYIVVLLLTTVLAGMFFVNHRQAQRRAAHMQQLQAEARLYAGSYKHLKLATKSEV